MSINIITKRGTAAQWTASNTVLLNGQQGLETDTGLSKYGDGSTAWTLLAYSNTLNQASVSTLPTPAFLGAGANIFVVDLGAAGKPVYSDGVNWRLYSDDSIVA